LKKGIYPFTHAALQFCLELSVAAEPLASLPNPTNLAGVRRVASMTKRSLYIAAYDIRDDQRLREALKVLRNYSTGGQKSVFECYLSEAEKRALLAEVRTVIDERCDRFLLLRLDPRRKVLVLGIAVPPMDPAYFYVG